MNRKQWFVLGIGLILLGLFFSFFGSMPDCNEMLVPGVNDDWVISCLNINVTNSIISTTIFTFGIIFVVLGFLESKWR